MVWTIIDNPCHVIDIALERGPGNQASPTLEYCIWSTASRRIHRRSGSEGRCGRGGLTRLICVGSRTKYLLSLKGIQEHCLECGPVLQLRPPFSGRPGSRRRDKGGRHGRKKNDTDHEPTIDRVERVLGWLAARPRRHQSQIRAPWASQASMMPSRQFEGAWLGEGPWDGEC